MLGRTRRETQPTSCGWFNSLPETELTLHLQHFKLNFRLEVKIFSFLLFWKWDYLHLYCHSSQPWMTETRVHVYWHVPHMDYRAWWPSRAGHSYCSVQVHLSISPPPQSSRLDPSWCLLSPSESSARGAAINCPDVSRRTPKRTLSHLIAEMEPGGNL